MGMTIDNVRGNRATELLEHISSLFTKEEIIAMLTELQLEIEEKSKWEGDYSFAQGELFCRDLIQEKINILRG